MRILAFVKLEKELEAEIKKNGVPSLIDHLRLCGNIPESYGHDTSEEKLYSKYTELHKIDGKLINNYVFLNPYSGDILKVRLNDPTFLMWLLNCTQVCCWAKLELK